MKKYFLSPMAGDTSEPYENYPYKKTCTKKTFGYSLKPVNNAQIAKMTIEPGITA